MEEQLKLRKSGSAKIRRQRIVDRHKQRALVQEQREERKKRLERYSAAYSIPDSDMSRPESPDNDSTAETPSEFSIQTPDNLSSPEVHIKGKADAAVAPINIVDDTQEETGLAHNMTQQSWPRSASKSRAMGASLNQPCDFRYDRFSTLMTGPALEQPFPGDLTGSDCETSGCESEGSEDEDYSPIEIATPVAISMPLTKPSVISVTVSGRSRKNVNRLSTKTTATTVTLKAIDTSEPRRSILAQSDFDDRNISGFFAGEAQPVQTPYASSISIVSMDSNPMSASPPVYGGSSLMKKRSMPKLSKFSHGRVKSIKSFISPLTSAPMPPTPYESFLHQHRPSTGTNSLFSSTSSHKSQFSSASIGNTGPPSPRRSVTDSLISTQNLSQAPRPHTAKPSDCSITIAAQAVESPKSHGPENEDKPAMSRRKSFTNLRRRSLSIGQALKSSSSKAKSAPTEELVPPLPPMQPQYHAMKTSSNVTTPQLDVESSQKLRRARKSGIMMYSPFPAIPKQGEPVGLGVYV